MAAATGLARQEGNEAESAGFFVPDLCASTSVFVMVLLAELLVVVSVSVNVPALFKRSIPFAELPST